MVSSFAPSSPVSSPSPGRQSLAQRLVGAIRRLVPAEGPVVVLLHLVMMLAVAWSVLEAGWVDGLQAIPLIVLAGTATGLLLAKAEAPDLAAHLTAFWLGLFVVVTYTVVQSADLGATYPQRARELATLFEEWTRSTANGQRMDDVHLFVVLMGLTGWLVAYMSAWTLYRRSWVTASLLLPGAVMMINLGYRPESGAEPLVLYIVAAGALVVAHFARRRRWDWQARGIQAPEFIGSRILAIGFNAVLVVTVIAWILPVSIREDLLRSTWQTLEQPVETAQGQLEEWLGELNGEGAAEGESYAAFDDSFDLGGALDLSTDPILEFTDDSGTAPYLAAQRMDAYNGRGWRSDAEATFERGEDDDRQPYSSRISFEEELPVPLSEDVTRDREATDGTIRILAPSDDLLFTRDTYRTSDLPTSVQLSWLQLEATRLPIATEAERSDLPPDLQMIADLLTQATFDEDGERVAASEPELVERIEGELASLDRRLVDVSWTVAEGAASELIVTGPLPVYDDVESVRARMDLSVNDRYEIGGVQSTATRDQLAGAGQEYPSYITDRYLQLPTTVTNGTRSLARTLVEDAGAETPFDMAVVIQNDLRTRIAYTESPPEPPTDRDVVDFVLFDSRAGYCEHYASAMAVMLRTLDIPSRVVTGFYPPNYDADAGGFVYREENAHVWVEAYFPGYGWIPFEPTANREAPSYAGDEPSGSPSPSPETSQSPSPSVDGSTEPSSSPSAAVSPSPSPSPQVPAATTDPTDPGSPVDGPLQWALLVAGIVLALLVVVAVALTIAWRRGLDGMSPVTALYARTVRLGHWLRIRGEPAMTPAEYAEQIGRTVPAARQPARLVAEQYSAEQYAPPSMAPSYPAGRRAWDDLRRSLLRAIPRLLSPRRRP